MKRILLFQAILCILLILAFALLLSNYSNVMQAKTKHNRELSKKKLPEEVMEQLGQNNSKASLYVLNVWESWCMPCLKEIPELNRIKADFNNKKIDFIAISSSTKTAGEQALKKNHTSFHYIKMYDQTDLIRKIDRVYYTDLTDYKVVVPQHIIINKEGEILLFLMGASDNNLLQIRTFIENYTDE